MPLSDEEKQRIYEEERIRSRARLDHSATPVRMGLKGCAIWYKVVAAIWLLLAVAALLMSLR